MKSKPVTKVVRQIGLWVLLVMVVAVSTLLFNILGVISTSVLAGLLMAASRRWQWQAIPVSLVFLLVSLALARFAQADLDARQRTAMVALSFGAFWVIYIPSLFLLRLEQQPAGGSDSATVKPSVPGTSGASASVNGRSVAMDSSVVVAMDSTDPQERFSLRDFEGIWFCEARGPDGEFRTRMMAVTRDKFALEIRNSRGLVRPAAEGALRLESVASPKTLLLAVMPDSKPASPR